MKKKFLCLLAIATLMILVACGKKEGNIVESNYNGEETISTEVPIETENHKEDNQITLEILMNHEESSKDDFEFNDNGNNELVLTKYVGSEDVVVIPDTVDGKPVVMINKYAFGNECKVKAIRLSNSIKHIDECAFSLNESLQIFVAGKDLENIGLGAFQSCTSLSVVMLNDKLKIIDELAFGSCVNLKEIEIPSSVEMINMSFFGMAEDFIIIGEAGSVAESYANEDGITFQAK